MSQIMPTSAVTGGVYVFDTFAAPWTETGMDGVVQKTARADRESGCSLGLLSFTRTAPVACISITASSLTLCLAARFPTIRTIIQSDR
jgi:hypothetical protein